MYLGTLFVASPGTHTVNKKDVAMLVRGEDTFGNFEMQPPPKAADDPEAVAQHRKGHELHETNTMGSSDPEKVAKKRCLGSNRNQPEHLRTHKGTEGADGTADQH